MGAAIADTIAKALLLGAFIVALRRHSQRQPATRAESQEARRLVALRTLEPTE
jgi:hypothetical protein